MKKRIRFIALILSALTMVTLACGSSADQMQNGNWSRIYAKELTEEVGISKNLDYGKISLQPLRQFSYELLENHLEECNPVFSPLSAYVTLCMIANGAVGETKEELMQVLGEDVMCLPDHIMNSLPQNKKEFQLTIANSVWMNDLFIAEKDWLGTVKSLFKASVYQADMDADTTKNDINFWVRENTNQMVPELLDEKLDRDVQMALLNALYLKAEWKNKFKESLTSTDVFHLDDGSEKEVLMMNQLYYDCEYLEDDSSIGVVLHYADSQYASIAIKPKEGRTIREWYGSYSAEKLHSLIQKREKKNLNLRLAKFSAKCKSNLNNSLVKMGIIRMFDMNQADFSKIGKSKEGNNLYLSKILQEAVLTVTEDGTEASAATIAEMCDGGGMIDAELVDFDSPFFYMIMDMNKEMPIFVGIFDEPEDIEEMEEPK